MRTDLVAFLDSDVVPVPGWLGLLRRHLDDPAVGVVGPRVLGGVPRPGDGWLCRYEAARSSLDLGPRPAPVQPLGRVAYLPERGPAGPPVALLRARHRRVRRGRCRWPRTSTWSGGVHEAGWRVRYEPAAAVRHDHRTTLGPWLRRKAFYGTGAALLAERHGTRRRAAGAEPVDRGADRGGAGAAALVAAAGRRGRASGSTATVARASCAPATTRCAPPASLTALGAVSSLQQAGSALTRHYWPVAVLAATRSPRARRALLVAAVADGLLDHRRVRPDLDPVRYVVARRLDDLAYGTGLWAGAARARSPRALVPAFRGFPFRRGTS